MIVISDIIVVKYRWSSSPVILIVKYYGICIGGLAEPFSEMSWAVRGSLNLIQFDAWLCARISVVYLPSLHLVNPASTTPHQ